MAIKLDIHDIVPTDEETDGVKRIKGLLNLKFGDIGKTTLVQWIIICNQFFTEQDVDSQTFVSSILDFVTKYYEGETFWK